MRNALRFFVFTAALLALAYFAIEYSDRSDESVQQELERLSEDLAAEAETLRERLGEAGGATNEKIEALLAESDRLQAQASKIAAAERHPPPPAAKTDDGPGLTERVGDSLKGAIDQLREWMRAKRREWFDE